MLVYTVFLLLSLLAGLFDFLFYRIPNVFVIGILLFFIPHMIHISEWSELAYVLAISGVVFVASFSCYLMGWIGAGDAKLLFACSVWAAGTDIVGFLLTTSLMGGLMALLYIRFAPIIDQFRKRIIHRLKPYASASPFLTHYSDSPFIKAQAQSYRHIKVPYGMAITTACLFVYYLALRG